MECWGTEQIQFWGTEQIQFWSFFRFLFFFEGVQLESSAHVSRLATWGPVDTKTDITIHPE